MKSRLPVIVNYQTWLPLTERWIYTQVKHLPPEIETTVVCGETRDPEQVPVPRLRAYSELSGARRAMLLAKAVPRLRRDLSRRMALLASVADETGAQLVHSHFGYTGYHSARAVERLGLKHIVTFYGVDMSALPRRDPTWMDRYAMLFEKVDKVLCEGPFMAEQVVKLGCPREKVLVHRLGVELELIPFRPRQWTPGTPLKVLMASSFREKKGIPLALEALGTLKDVLPLQVTIVGDAGRSVHAQHEKQRIVEAVKALGLENHVTFPGYQPHDVLMRLAYEHHVFLAPSLTASDGDSEGGAPVVLIEMAASGMPVISTRHADIPEVIEDGVGGALCDENDAAGLACNLKELAEACASWISITRQARSRLESRFDSVKQGRLMGDLYRGLCTGATSGAVTELHSL